MFTLSLFCFLIEEIEFKICEIVVHQE